MFHVKHADAGPPPEAGRTLFGDRLPDVQRYAEILLEKATRDTYPSLALLDRVRALSDIG